MLLHSVLSFLAACGLSGLGWDYVGLSDCVLPFPHSIHFGGIQTLLTKNRSSSFRSCFADYIPVTIDPDGK
jgi:hypothetical protein